MTFCFSFKTDFLCEKMKTAPARGYECIRFETVRRQATRIGGSVQKVPQDKGPIESRDKCGVEKSASHVLLPTN